MKLNSKEYDMRIQLQFYKQSMRLFLFLHFWDQGSSSNFLLKQQQRYNYDDIMASFVCHCF